jgi:predicted enzyme related to lactoylglutathione lyase
MAANAVTWFEIYVQDMPRARGFYEKVFERKLERLDSGDIEMWSFQGVMGEYGSGGALVRIPGVPSGGMGTIVYFECDDSAVEGARVAGAGGRIHREKMSIGQYGFIVLAVDTEGNMIGLHSMK